MVGKHFGSEVEIIDLQNGEPTSTSLASENNPLSRRELIIGLGAGGLGYAAHWILQKYQADRKRYTSTQLGEMLSNNMEHNWRRVVVYAGLLVVSNEARVYNDPHLTEGHEVDLHLGDEEQLLIQRPLFIRSTLRAQAEVDESVHEAIRQLPVEPGVIGFRYQQSGNEFLYIDTNSNARHISVVSRGVEASLVEADIDKRAQDVNIDGRAQINGFAIPYILDDSYLSAILSNGTPENRADDTDICIQIQRFLGIGNKFETSEIEEMIRFFQADHRYELFAADSPLPPVEC